MILLGHRCTKDLVQKWKSNEYLAVLLLSNQFTDSYIMKRKQTSLGCLHAQDPSVLGKSSYVDIERFAGIEHWHCTSAAGDKIFCTCRQTFIDSTILF